MKDWKPTANLKALRLRAELYALLRRFFAERGVLEVWRDTKLQFSAPLRDLQQQWDEVSWRIARERDNPLRPALYAHALHHALAGWPTWGEYHDWLGGQFFYHPGQWRGAQSDRAAMFFHDLLDGRESDAFTCERQ